MLRKKPSIEKRKGTAESARTVSSNRIGSPGTTRNVRGVHSKRTFSSAIALGANADTASRGMVVLGFYSIGLGVPFLLSALLLAKAFSFFDVIKRFLTPISVASGLLLAGFGVLMVTGQIVELNAWFSRILIDLGLEGLAEV